VQRIRHLLSTKTILYVEALPGPFSNDLSIDLGTANTLIYVKSRGIVRTTFAPRIVQAAAD
jgi:actin-like ATPase involved in cell morphogenesis